MDIINLYEKSENLFFVGGIVRDELLGKQSPDIDLTFVGNAIDFAHSFNFGEITQINEEFGSVHLNIDNKTVDITSTRTERYPNKGQLPVVDTIACPLKDDVKRRDFTINAIAKNCKSGKIVDYVGGIEDLKNKTLRILHDESFIDDPTRIIRGLKFAVRFGFELDEHTKKLQDEYLENVDYNMSFKRLKDELVDAFNLNNQEVLHKFIEQKMYKLLSLKQNNVKEFDVQAIVDKYSSEIKNIWICYLGSFNLSNLPLTKSEMKIIEDYKKLLNADLSSDFKIYKAFEKVEIESLILLAQTKKDIVEKYLDKLRKIKLQITGEDLIKMGYKPSKKFAQVLDAVLQAVIENPTLDHVQQLGMVEKFMWTFVKTMPCMALKGLQQELSCEYGYHKELEGLQVDS